MEYVLLAFVALLPATFYMFYIIAFDSKKPEPPRVLLISALLGGVAALSVALIGTPHQVGMIQIENSHSLKESIEIGFLKLAIPAEIVKWLILCVFLSLNRFYDEYIDGIVYSVCLSMGYAGVWGASFLSYYTGHDFSAFIEMSILTVIVLIPIHFIVGTFMGYFLALARKKRRIRNHTLALILPILVDGLLCSLVAAIGRDWEYYFIMGVVLSIFAMVMYSQIFHILKLDGIRVNKHQ